MLHNHRMNYGEYTYIWQSTDWPKWRFDLAFLANDLASVSHAQGLLRGRLSDLGLVLREQISLEALTEDVVKTSEIEGEYLSVVSVRSSVARHLGVDIGALAPVDRHVEGVVDMILDATSNCHELVTEERLHRWHENLFPSGYSGFSKIKTGGWRDDANGAMQVISGPIGKERVHFEAPPAKRLNNEISAFLKWLNTDSTLHPLIKAGIGHLWFVTLHPFDDGNGRIARAIGDLLLARADGSPQRFYSLSAQIQRERNAYYKVLEKTQKTSMDINEWLQWFLSTLRDAINQSHQALDAVIFRAKFWQRWSGVSLNERQIKLMNRLLNGFEGKLTTAKWAVIAKSSQDTALRDISELINLGILIKSHAGGRSTSYELAPTNV